MAGQLKPTLIPVLIAGSILYQIKKKGREYKTGMSPDRTFHELVLIEHNDCFKLIKR